MDVHPRPSFILFAGLVMDNSRPSECILQFRPSNIPTTRCIDRIKQAPQLALCSIYEFRELFQSDTAIAILVDAMEQRINEVIEVL